MKRRLIVATVLALGCVPAMARAAIAIVQDSCEPAGDYPIAHFSIDNATNLAVCTMTLLPVDASCFLISCAAPGGWSCFPGDVTTFFSADASGECVAAGQRRSGFSAKLFAAFCCQTANFFGSAGEHIGTQEICFDCDPVGVERAHWGRVKRLYD